MRKYLRHILFLIPVVAAFAGCGLVDEDMSDCETDYTLDYELRLVTNMTTELQTELSLAADVQLSTSLKTYLKDVFTDFAHDVDLGFYDVVRDEMAGDSLRLHHESHIMDANQTRYTLYIPVRKYQHLAVANIEDNGIVSLENGGLCHSARLVQTVRDTLSCHRTGLFTARLPMDIKEGEDQQFNVRLYMANCASAIVIDTTDSGVRDVKAFATGFATGFNICDSTYNFSYTPVIRADRIELDEPGRVCFATVTFPSRGVKDTKTIIDTDDPFVSEYAEQSLWRYKVYTTLPDGSVTESILGITKPLHAGQFKIIKVKVLNNGGVQPSDPTVGVSVTLDWTPGQEYDVPL